MEYVFETSTFEALPPFIPKRAVNPLLRGVGRSADWKYASSPHYSLFLNNARHLEQKPGKRRPSLGGNTSDKIRINSMFDSSFVIGHLLTRPNTP
ncbi:hypothetical protein [Brevibacillus porteri]|uniref:hypothetical protein n=1 Tax=Brevibacillus porteri TaxID=2126350 RepID=UPI002E1E8D0D|nr:hypothetical protein [Brevibacillus porteri]MED2893817.1 hypothetical protein [Brevibacillus porteri]